MGSDAPWRREVPWEQDVVSQRVIKINDHIARGLERSSWIWSREREQPDRERQEVGAFGRAIECSEGSGGAAGQRPRASGD